MTAFIIRFFKQLSLSKINFIFIGALVIMLGNCSKVDEYQYSPYLQNKPPQWGSLDAALKASKFFGTIEVSRFSDKEQTQKQKAAADAFVKKVITNVHEKSWFEIERAKSDGFVFEPEKDWSHFPNYNHLFDNEDLNPEKPEYLMFHKTNNGKWVLTGVMFMLEDLYAHGEQIGGPETVWHFHDYSQEAGGGRCDIWFKIPEGHRYESQVRYDKCEEGVFVTRSPEMLHVWFVDHHEGRFGTTMMVDDQKVKTSRFYSQSKGEWESNASTQ